MTVRTLLVDDNAELLHSLGDALSDAPGIEVVAMAVTGDEALRLARLMYADVAVLDVGMPGGGPDLVRAMCALEPSPRILVFSGRDDADTVSSMIAAGATAFVAKGGLVEDFRHCVMRCAEGHFFVMASCAGEVRRRFAEVFTSRRRLSVAPASGE